ncbi:MAG: 3-oxo-5-alpha-steroid 4-dehydrogenase [Verrucomicrobia bacterium]|nr:3-oxo-5-alpha-steroid 4-dehydrogenase [Verrucomicrobiota bacterium]
MNAWQLLLIALAALCVAFAGLYFVARRFDNYGVVDIAWSYAFGGLTAFYALGGPGWPVRRALVAAMVVLWSARLGTHLAIRVIGHHPVEDGRYKQLRKDWAGNFKGKMFGFFQMQAVSVVVLGVGFLVVCLNPAPTLHPLEIVGAGVWLLALSGEAVSDAQLAAFKRNARNKGQVCDIGLWRYSRHPNYFFEWLIWVGYFAFALGSPWGWLAIVGPASILYLLLRVTGIPMTEEQSLRSRGDAYRRYQERTSAFIPLPPSKRPPAV